jgi:hypothetical protein
MNPPTRKRLTESGVRLAIGETTGMPCFAIVLAGRLQFGTERRDDALCHRTRHDVAVHGPVLGGEVEEPQDTSARVAVDVSGRRGERHRECGGDGVVAVAEVLVEDLPADFGAGDDVTDRQLIDWALVGQQESRLPQASAHPFGAGIDAVRSCCHRSSVSHFVDS